MMAFYIKTDIISSGEGFGRKCTRIDVNKKRGNGIIGARQRQTAPPGPLAGNLSRLADFLDHRQIMHRCRGLDVIESLPAEALGERR